MYSIVVSNVQMENLKCQFTLYKEGLSLQIKIEHQLIVRYIIMAFYLPDNVQS